MVQGSEAGQRRKEANEGCVTKQVTTRGSWSFSHLGMPVWEPARSTQSEGQESSPLAPH